MVNKFAKERGTLFSTFFQGFYTKNRKNGGKSLTVGLVRLFDHRQKLIVVFKTLSSELELVSSRPVHSKICRKCLKRKLVAVR